MFTKISLIDKEFIGEDEKKCAKCGLVKQRSEFNKNPNLKDGLQSACKSCMRTYADNRPSFQRTKNNKKCLFCNLIKPASEFYTDRKRKDGLTARCKKCIREYALEVKIREKIIPKEKRCPRCGIVKTASEFWKCKFKANGLYSHCIKCLKLHRKTRLAILNIKDTKGIKDNDLKKVESWNEVDSILREIAETQLTINAEEKACKNRVSMIIKQSSEAIAPYKRHQHRLRYMLESFLKKVWLYGDSQREFRFGTIKVIRKNIVYNINVALAKERLGLP